MKAFHQAFALGVILLSLAAGAGAQDYGSVDLIVAQRDYLIHICQIYGIDPARIPQIAAANRLSDPDLILPGQIIRVPVEWIGGMEDEGIVTFVEGEAVRKARKAPSWEPLRLKDAIRSGDEVRTGDDGRLEISFGSGNILTLRPRTRLIVLLTKKFSEMNIFQKIILETGKIIAGVKEVTGRTSRYEVKTPSAVAAARGTNFRIGLDERENTRAEIAKGRVGVEASGIWVEVGEGEGTIVPKGQPPLAPRKLLPAPSFIDLPRSVPALPVTINFTEISGAAGYRLVLSHDPDGRAVVRELQVKSGEAAVLPAGIDAGAYYLLAQAIDRDGLEGLAAPAVPLVIQEALPLEPRSPVDGAIIAGPAIDIVWPDIPRTGRYHLQIAEDVEFNRLVVDRIDLAAVSFRVNIPKPGLYWLRARAVSEEGREAPFGPARKIQVIPLPAAPTLSDPEVKGKALRFTCRNLGPGFVYRFQLAGDDRFGAMLEERLSPKPEIAFVKPSAPGVYYARVAAVSSEGLEGPFSEVRVFRIVRGGLWRYICLLPAIALLIVLLV